MKELWTFLASLMGVVAFCQTLLHSLVPPEVRNIAGNLFHRLFHSFSSYCYYDIGEGDGVSTNVLYNAVQLYLSRSASVSASRLSLSRPFNSSAFTFSLANNHRLVDHFCGASAVWEHIVTPRHSPNFSWRSFSDEKRGFTLQIHKKDRQVLLSNYLQHIMDTATELRRKNQDRLLYTNSRSGGGGDRGLPWESVPFKHPSTFETLAMDPDDKKVIMDDLKDFAEGKTFYEKTGRAWKRGYLLYGPPGTGKSSMIAAMANYLEYDIFDLELTEVQTNSELRKLLMKTSPKSIIVIEDIDCSVNLGNRDKNGSKNQQNLVSSVEVMPQMRGDGATGEDVRVLRTLTLSGLLNFTDGLWSCCGSERIFVFTTNHVEKLDPALLRSGRMDLHILMGYCSFSALRILLKNYLGVEDTEFDVEESLSEVLKQLEEVIGEAEITPADVSEVLIKNRRKEKGVAMDELLGVLRTRVEEKKKAAGHNAGEGLRGKCDGDELEEEEQEKRALESTLDDDEQGREECNGKDEKFVE